MPSVQNNCSKRISVCRILLLLIALFPVISASSQNLNNPNKRGPLGTQVNTLSGNLFLSRTDIYIPARGFDLNISFSYNSFLFTEDYGYGKGWTFRYNIQYSHDTSTQGARLILWGDGREDKYDSLPGGGYKTPKGFFSTLAEYQPGKYVLTELNGVKFFFDNATHKRITRMEEPNGNYISFSYTGELLTTMSNAASQTITFNYNPDGRLISVTDAVSTPARTFTYSYDAAGNLKEVKDPLNGKYQYTYLVNGPMKSLADRNNNKVDIIYFPDLTARELIGCNKRLSFSYDTTSQTTIVTDHLETGNQVTKYTYQTVDNLSWITSMSGNCCGFNVSYEYDEQGNQTKMTDANGQVYTYTYDENGSMLTATDPLGQVSTYTYTTDFKKIDSYKDPKGNLYTISYDANGNMTQLITPGNNIYAATYNAAGDIITSTDPKGNTYTYNYDAVGNPTNVSGPNGYNAILSFDARGRLLSYTDARGNNSTAEYDILNRLKRITDPINNNVQFNYDAAGNITSVINKNNETSIFDYDASNRIVKVTGPTGNEAGFTYDGMDNLTSVKNALGHETKLSYDNRNRLKGAKDPENNNAIYNYDANGNMTSISLPNGQSLNYTYDQLNRLIAVSDATSTIATLAYDKNSNVTSYTNATGATVSASYDSLDRLKQITDPLGNSASYVYDKNNNIISVTDREGHTSHYTYDSLDRVKTYTDNNGFVITVGYDAESNITSLTDQNNNTTTYTYDNLNRRKRMTYPDGKFAENTYDNKSNVTAIRLTDGTTINYQYDTLNRVVSRTLPGGEVYSFTYDKLSRVLTATNNNGTTSFTYDALNRVTSESFDGRTINYSYSIAGRTQTTVYPDSSVVLKEFDTRNRLIKVLKDGVTVAEYAYNNANQLTQKTFGNGANSILQYDFANRLSSMTTTAASGSIQNSQFSYDKEYNKTAITRLDDLSLSEQFTYDNGYRLTNYKRGPAGSPVIQNTYTYDAVGNRTAANLNGVATTYSINNLNQLTGVNGNSFTFDDKGNITYDGTFYKTYDAENRLVKDSSSPASVISYGYDALNRRITKAINGNVLKYTYSGAAQIEERNNSNVLLNRTIYNGFLSPVMNEKDGNSFYYHSNELGSVEAITNNSGRLVESYRYDAYGKLSRYDSLSNPLASSIAGNRFGFTGQEYDSASGSYRFFFRNYSPETGVFNQRDLIEYGDGMGMYQYVGNNPANGVDVWGLQCHYTDIYNSMPKSAQEEVDRLRREAPWEEIALYVNNNLFGAANSIASVAAAKSLVANPFTGIAVTPLTAYSTAKSVNSLSANWETNTTGQNIDGSIGVASGMLSTGIGFVTTAEVGGTAVTTWFTGAGVSGSIGAGMKAASVTFATPVGVVVLATAGGLAIYGLTNEGAKVLTGRSLQEIGELIPNPIVESMFDGSTTTFLDFLYNNNLSGKLDYDEIHRAKAMWENDRAVEYLLEKKGKKLDYDSYYQFQSQCNQGGTRKRGRWVWDEQKQMFVFIPFDPNLIIGPAGQSDKKWVSVKERMPYTILFENDSSATARARYIKITTPIEPKQDAATLELGSVGFNNQSFEIPQDRSSYYQRLDARDSTGVYVDLTAGYDVINNQIFWEFQAIDPITLLPPEDPEAGFLFLRDTANPTYGNGFVNFSIKPRADAQTLDTIGARAFIIFDENEVIPTNIHTNTIDALPPASQLNAASVTDNLVTLSWTGADDAGGSGIDHYTVYVSTDQVNYSVLFPTVIGTDTTFILPQNPNYCFFVLATDKVGHTETFNPAFLQCASISGPLPVTWLYFNGSNQGRDNILKWGTASEQNSKEFRLERSLNGTDFNQVAVVPAAGNSSVNRDYSYTDRGIDRLNSNVMFYRLKQVDQDDNFRYSTIVRLHYRENNKAPTIVYPNPTGGMVTLVLGDQSLLGSEALVMDINGRVLQRVKLTAASQSINLQPYINGMYLIRLSNKETLKVIKQ